MQGFFEKPPHHLSYPIYSVVILEAARSLKLYQQVSSPFDRASHQLWEKTNKREKGNDISCHRQFTSIHVNRIT